jgi:hypothetical protein
MDENGEKVGRRTTDTRGRRHNRIIEQRSLRTRIDKERRRGCPPLFASLVIDVTIWLDGGVATASVREDSAKKVDMTRGQLTKA